MRPAAACGTARALAVVALAGLRQHADLRGVSLTGAIPTLATGRMISSRDRTAVLVQPFSPPAIDVGGRARFWLNRAPEPAVFEKNG